MRHYASRRFLMFRLYAFFHTLRFSLRHAVILPLYFSPLMLRRADADICAMLLDVDADAFIAIDCRHIRCCSDDTPLRHFSPPHRYAMMHDELADASLPLPSDYAMLFHADAADAAASLFDDVFAMIRHYFSFRH